MTQNRARKRSLVMSLLVALFKLAWSSLVIFTPLFAVWLASALAAFFNGPVWLAMLSGALLFPLLPLAWEWRSACVYARLERPRSRILTFADRMLLRTLCINVPFVLGLMAYYPEQSFHALSTRGDFMLDGVEHEQAERVRTLLLSSAEGLEFLYLWTRDDPYSRFDDGSSDKIVPKPEPRRRTQKKPMVEEEKKPPRAWGEAFAWPMPERLHPIVKHIPSAHASSLELVAKYIAAHEKDPFLRVKALHDYAVHHLDYDHERLRSGRLTHESQQPHVVFQSGLAVCAGYAKLLVEMGKHTGDNIVYVRGVSRDRDGKIRGSNGHAWNAVEIEGAWYLMDATWNDPTNSENPSEKSYRTTYLFTPASIFGIDHFPDNEAWQLRRDPLTRGAFLRQPLVAPEFHIAGLELHVPQRSQFASSSRTFLISLKNKRKSHVLANLVTRGHSRSGGRRCHVAQGSDVRITCEAQHVGTYEVILFAGSKGLHVFPYVGKFEAHVR